MTDKDRLMEILEAGERVNLECKAAKSEIPKDTWETYSSFCNTYGGIILLGVSENLNAANRKERFTITGVKKPEQRIKDFWDTLNSDKVNRNLLRDQDVSSLTVDDASILMINVPEADYKQKPVYINGNPYKGTFRRNFEGDYRCSEEEVLGMIRDSSDEPADNFVLENYDMNDIDSKSLESYRNEFNIAHRDHVWNALPDKDFLVQMGGYRKDRRTGKEGLTLAGLLMFGKGLSIREALPLFSVDYLDQTEISDSSRWTDRLTIDGTWENNLYTFIKLVLPKLTKNLKKSFQMDGVVRIDETPVHASIREGLMNCVIHADYQRSGKINIIQYENGFLFSNPGNLKLPVSVIFQGGHTASRNPAIQRMFRMIGLCEEIGSGIPVILNTWRSSGWKEPELYDSLDTHTVELRLWMSSNLKEHEDYLHFLFGDDLGTLSDTEREILYVVAEEKQVTLSRIQPVLKKNPNEILKIMSGLVHNGFLTDSGIGMNLFWQLNQNYSKKHLLSKEKRSLNSTSEEIIDLLKTQNTLTNRQIVKRIPSITTVQGAVYAMRKLIEQNLVTVEKEGRQNVYRLKSSQ